MEDGSGRGPFAQGMLLNHTSCLVLLEGDVFCQLVSYCHLPRLSWSCLNVGIDQGSR